MTAPPAGKISFARDTWQGSSGTTPHILRFPLLFTFIVPLRSRLHICPPLDTHPTTSSLSSNEIFWQEANINIDALTDIVATHMRSPCQPPTAMTYGAYARLFVFILENDVRVVGRLVLPVREHLKTEAEVSAMVFARSVSLAASFRFLHELTASESVSLRSSHFHSCPQSVPLLQ